MIKKLCIWVLIMAFIISAPLYGARKLVFKHIDGAVSLEAGKGPGQGVLEDTTIRFTNQKPYILMVGHFGGTASKDADITFYWTIADTAGSFTLHMEGTSLATSWLHWEWGPPMDSVNINRVDTTCGTSVIPWRR